MTSRAFNISNSQRASKEHDLLSVLVELETIMTSLMPTLLDLCARCLSCQPAWCIGEDLWHEQKTSIIDIH